MTRGLTGAEYSQRAKDRVQSSVSVVHQFLREALDLSELNLFVRLNNSALNQAQALDLRLRLGNETGPMHGVPIIFADNVHVLGFGTTGASVSLFDFRPEAEDLCIQNLRDAGSMFLGKTNMVELGLGITSANSYFGRVKSRRKHMTGGNSAGLPFAISEGLAPVGVGIEQPGFGGIKVPAAYAEVFAFMPSFGILETSAVLKVTERDNMGIVAQHFDDIILARNVMTNPNDDLFPVHPSTIRVGVPQFTMKNVEHALLPDYSAIIDSLRNVVTVKRVYLQKDVRQLLVDTQDVAPFELVQNMKQNVESCLEDTTFEEFISFVQDEDAQKMLNTTVDADEYAKALETVEVLRRAVAEAFLVHDVSVMLLPAMVLDPSKPRELTREEVNRVHDNSLLSSLLGLPSLTIPTHGLSLELFSPLHTDNYLLSISKFLIQHFNKDSHAKTEL